MSNRSGVMLSLGSCCAITMSRHQPFRFLYLAGRLPMLVVACSLILPGILFAMCWNVLAVSIAFLRIFWEGHCFRFFR